MHEVTKKCLGWGIGLIVLGAILLVWGTDWYVAVAGADDGTGDAGLAVFNLVLAAIRNTCFPLGAGLISAAVVIQALAPKVAR